MSGKTDVRINTILGKESEFVGDFVTKGSARIDGSVNGNVKVSGMLIVGVAGFINGSVEAHSTIIGGEVLGNVAVEEKTELTGTARVLGDVITKVIVIDENAVFQGKCNMNQDVPDAKRRKSVVVKAARAGRKSAKAAIQEALKEVEEEERMEAMEQTQIPEFNPESPTVENIVV